MPFFQNVYIADYRGSFPLGDRQKSPTYICPKNAGRGNNIVVAWNKGPYDLSGNDSDANSSATLNIKLAFDSGDFKNWGTVSVDISAGADSAAAVQAWEAVAALNADTSFSPLFTASLNQAGQILITQKAPVTRLHFYIANGQAEEKLRFNQRSGVSELPTYCERHTVDNGHVFIDSESLLVLLDPVSNVDSAVIDDARDFKGNKLNLDSGTVQADWELLGGESGLFNFQKITVDIHDRITQIIEYPAGAGVGDFSRKIQYIYTSTNTKPDQITEIPYVLTSGDLITP